jgi:endonuclease YncB( thermonuclease family)
VTRKFARSKLTNRIRWRLQITVVIGVLFAAVTFIRGWQTPPLPVGPLSGAARIMDGDTMRIAGDSIRLAGIDAPERDQTCRINDQTYSCGRDAADQLATLVEGRDVECHARRRDRYHRLLGFCTAGGMDLNRRMVETGWAVGYQHYQAEEQAARNARIGLWRGEFDQPRDFRRDQGNALSWWSWWPW